MARLGELLVARGALSAEQIDHALRAQVMWGGRLGTNLIELGYLDLDKLAQTLGRQHRLPAALGRHFERADSGLQRRLSADVAERFACVPLMHGAREKAQVIVAILAPLDRRAITLIAGQLGVDPEHIVPAIAAELRIKYHLERVYRIARETRFLRPRGKSIPPFPHFEINPFACEDSQVDVPLPSETAELPLAPRPTTGPLAASSADLSIAQEVEDLAARLASHGAVPLAVEPEPTAPIDDVDLLEVTGDDELAALAVAVDGPSKRELRRYVRTIDDAPSSDSDRQPAVGRIAIRRVAAAATTVAEVPVDTGLTLGEATRAIRRSLDRDRVAELVVETLFRFALSCEAALMLVVRGGAAMSWKGFSRTGAPQPEIAIPMDQPGLVPLAVGRNATTQARADDLGPIDQLLLVSLAQTTGNLVVVPVSIAGQVMCVIAMATEPDARGAVTSAESIAAAAGAAFARLMRDASR